MSGILFRGADPEPGDPEAPGVARRPLPPRVASTVVTRCREVDYARGGGLSGATASECRVAAGFSGVIAATRSVEAGTAVVAEKNEAEQEAII